MFVHASKKLKVNQLSSGLFLSAMLFARLASFSGCGGPEKLQRHIISLPASSPRTNTSVSSWKVHTYAGIQTDRTIQVICITIIILKQKMTDLLHSKSTLLCLGGRSLPWTSHWPDVWDCTNYQGFSRKPSPGVITVSAPSSQHWCTIESGTT